MHGFLHRLHEIIKLKKKKLISRGVKDTELKFLFTFAFRFVLIFFFVLHSLQSPIYPAKQYQTNLSTSFSGGKTRSIKPGVVQRSPSVPARPSLLSGS